MWNQVRIYRKLQCPVEAHKLVKKTDCSHSPIVCIMMHCWNEAHIAILGFFLRGGSNGCNIKSEFTANSKKIRSTRTPPPKKTVPIKLCLSKQRQQAHGAPWLHCTQGIRNSDPITHQTKKGNYTVFFGNWIILLLGCLLWVCPGSQVC